MNTKKDFKYAAELLNSSYPITGKDAKIEEKDRAVETFVSFFRSQNPKFNAKRFREACGTNDL